MHQVFISATTRDLARARQHLTNLVLQAGHHPIVEQGFQAQSNDVELRQFLSLHLRACSAMIPSGRTKLRWRGYHTFDARDAAILDANGVHRGKAPGQEHPRRSRRPRLLSAASAFARRAVPQEQRRKAQSQRAHCLQLQKGLYYPFRRFSDPDGPRVRFPAAAWRRARAASKTKILFIGAEQGTGLDLRGQLRRTRQALSVAPRCARNQPGAAVQRDAGRNLCGHQPRTAVDRAPVRPPARRPHPASRREAEARAV